MARSVSQQPTEVELQILRILWHPGGSTARQIHNELTELKGTTYSTTVKMLSVMRDKELVKRDEDESPHVYRATVSRNAAGKRMVRDLVDKVYDGAAMSLVLHALKNATASQGELDEVRRLLDEMEGKT